MNGALRHKGCGGGVYDDRAKLYNYEGKLMPAVRCDRCGEEILGDADLEQEGDEDEGLRE